MYFRNQHPSRYILSKSVLATEKALVGWSRDIGGDELLAKKIDKKYVKGKSIPLTDSNFKQVVSHFEHVLVEFTTGWCPKCKKNKPVIFEAAKKLGKLSDAMIGIVDVDKDKEV